MDATQPLWVLFNLSSIADTHTIETSDGRQVGGGSPHRQVYTWVAFFKIDGDTVFVNEGFRLEGTAIGVATPGNHGDLGDTGDMAGNSTQVISIPPEIGQFRTVLRPIPLKVPLSNISSVPGAVGCVALLIEDGGLPGHAVAQGHEAFNHALQTQLDQIIGTLGLAKHSTTDDDVAAMTKAISDAVESAIKDDLSFWEKLFALFVDQDKDVGHSLFQFSGADLAIAPPTGVPLLDSFSVGGTGTATDGNGNSIGYVTDVETYGLQGAIFCHSLPSSLRRFLQSQQLSAAAGVRAGMQLQFSGVRTWMESALW